MVLQLKKLDCSSGYPIPFSIVFASFDQMPTITPICYDFFFMFCCCCFSFSLISKSLFLFSNMSNFLCLYLKTAVDDLILSHSLVSLSHLLQNVTATQLFCFSDGVLLLQRALLMFSLLSDNTFFISVVHMCKDRIQCEHITSWVSTFMLFSAASWNTASRSLSFTVSSSDDQYREAVMTLSIMPSARLPATSISSQVGRRW